MAESRSSFLLELVRNFFEARKDWVEHGPDHITRQLEDAINDLLGGWSEGSIPGDLRPMERVVSGPLRRNWDEFTQRAARTGDTRELPADTFWQAVTELERAEKQSRPQQRRMIETIVQLDAQKVSDHQICLIYGWVDDDGAPELWKLQEERREPGKHTQDWVPPGERKRLEQEQNEDRIRARLRERTAKKVQRLTQPCNESMEELIQQGLSARQIASMRRCTIEDVFAAADELELERPALEYASANSQRGSHEPELNDETARAYETSTRARKGERPRLPQPAEEDEAVYDPAAHAAGFDGEDEEEGFSAGGEGEDEMPVGAMTLEQEIIHYHRQGLDAASIAENVSQDGKKVGVRKVNAVLRRYQESPADFVS